MSNVTYPNPGIKWGLIAGLIVIATGLALYYVDQETLFSLKFNFIQLFICAVTGLLAGMEKRSKEGGFIGFKTALQPIFLTFVIGTLVGTVLMYVIANYIDPELPARMKAADISSIEALQKDHKNLNITEADLNDQLTKLKQQDYTLTFVASMLSYFTGLFLNFIISAVLAALIRRPKQA